MGVTALPQGLSIARVTRQGGPSLGRAGWGVGCMLPPGVQLQL